MSVRNGAAMHNPRQAPTGRDEIGEHIEHGDSQPNLGRNMPPKTWENAIYMALDAKRTAPKTCFA